MTDSQPVKRRRGCLFYVFLVGILVLSILTGQLLGLLQTLRTFTDATPHAFPPVSISTADGEQLQRRADAFRDNVRAGRRVDPLSLSANEINALITSYPDLHLLKGKLYIRSLESNQINAQVSIPTSQIPVGIFKFFKNRYLNGTALLNLSFTNGTLRLTLQSLTAKGKPLPPRYLQSVQRKNLAQPINDDARLSVGLNKVQSIQARDGKLVIVPESLQ